MGFLSSTLSASKIILFFRALIRIFTHNSLITSFRRGFWGANSMEEYYRDKLFSGILFVITLGLLFVCKSELTEFFEELTEFAAELSEFSLSKQCSRNSIPPHLLHSSVCPNLSGQYSRDWSEYVNVIGVTSEPFARELR